MGIEVALLGIGLGLAVKGSIDSRNAQKDMQKVQKASNAAEAAKERRQQIREERVRRAMVLASSEASGTQGSSGESGAVADLSTQLSSNIGYNIGAQERGNQMSIFQQDLANSQMLSQLGGIAVNASGSSIFQKK